MPYSVDQKIVGLGKETTRGTAATAISRYLAVDKATEFDYKVNLIQDEQVRGTFDRFGPVGGIKDGTGKIAGIDVQSDNIGEIFLSLLGNVSTEDLSPAYKHTFTRSNNIQTPSYTIFFERGISKKAYPLSVVKSIALTGTMDGKVKMDADILFKTEESTEVTFSPSWENPTPFMFYQTDIKLATTSNIDIRSWSLNIDNQSIIQRTLNQSQDIRNIITPSKLLISGGFEIYFENETERTKFLSATSSSLEIILTGGVITGSINHQLVIKLPRIHYDTYSYGELDGLLGSAVTFNAYFNPGQTIEKSVVIELTNTVNNY